MVSNREFVDAPRSADEAGVAFERSAVDRRSIETIFCSIAILITCINGLYSRTGRCSEVIMDCMDRAVLEAADAWQLAGAVVALGTVIRTWGWAPRPVGSMVAIRGDGIVKGSVSGGCIEGDLSHRRSLFPFSPR
ncbi:XdhC family protein [Paraburkholderia sp. BL9I2N2]|uniref:XdhC family protein n=1 Tax=Paraburkholderia sp. BL9I2N2 TaxID=1938809 RepID=UPI0032611B75